MFSKKNQTVKENKTNTIDTVIGQGTSVTGTLTSSSSVRIDGEWQGDVHVEGSLTIGQTGSIEGQITAKNIVVEGSVVGNIFTEEHLHLSSSARVNGDIQSFSLEIESGAHFEGKSTMLPNKQASSTPKSNKKKEDTQQVSS